MAKYKKLTPELIEGFFDKMFGKITTQAGKDVVKQMSKSDPSVGKKLARVANMIKKLENDMKGMSKAQQAKYEKDIWKKAGVK
jgi:hypothetical protein|tara:strand:+ start:215 stop:463 length:249 start_codon:yes stop_codon:yes gene_type:complete